MPSAQAIQAKPTIGSVDDPLEREADRIADAVVSDTQLTGGASAVVRPKRADCAAEEQSIRRQTEDDELRDEPIQAKAAHGTLTTAGIAASASTLASGGVPLAAETRAYFEPRFGVDFSAVRVHSDTAAQSAGRAINARAFTLGRDIGFASNEYAPSTREGRRLIAHELAHVLQQTGGFEPIAVGGLISGDGTGRIARQAKPAATAQPTAAPSLAELNGWPMESILARLDQLAEAPLLALITEAKTVKGLNAPRLQLALDVVHTKKFARAILPEFEAILPSRMEAIIPMLENADQQKAIKKYLTRARPAKPKRAGALSAPLGAGDKPIPASQLSDFGSAEETAFKHQVYEAHVAVASRVRKFSMGVAPADLMSIGGGHRLRKDAAPDMNSLLAKAKEDLKAAQDAGDELAQSVKSIGVGSSYRDTKQDFGLWDQYFKKYYEATQKKRDEAEGGPLGPKAVSIMVTYYVGSKAAPGFSNHSSGIAVDFTTTEGKTALGSEKSQNARWKKSWLHQWLVANAATYNFEPLSTEAFHWSHKIADPPPAEPPHSETDKK